jgi:hypothetical protein
LVAAAAHCCFAFNGKKKDEREYFFMIHKNSILTAATKATIVKKSSIF